MNELVKVNKDQEGKQVVDARELHEFLEVNAKFADWIKRMIEYGFTEGEDFTTLLKKENRQTLKEYVITLDMAKKLVMTVDSDRGDEVRNSFLECEKELRTISALPDFTNPALAARAWADEVEQKQKAGITKRTDALS